MGVKCKPIFWVSVNPTNILEGPAVALSVWSLGEHISKTISKRLWVNGRGKTKPAKTGWFQKWELADPGSLRKKLALCGGGGEHF